MRKEKNNPKLLREIRKTVDGNKNVSHGLVLCLEVLEATHQLQRKFKIRDFKTLRRNLLFLVNKLKRENIFISIHQ